MYYHSGYNVKNNSDKYSCLINNAHDCCIIDVITTISNFEHDPKETNLNYYVDGYCCRHKIYIFPLCIERPMNDSYDNGDDCNITDSDNNSCYSTIMIMMMMTMTIVTIIVEW